MRERETYKRMDNEKKEMKRKKREGEVEKRHVCLTLSMHL